MSTSSTAATPLQSHHIRNLILILRRANVHYTHVASRIRASLKPTGHAHKRAQRLGLTINVKSAVACPQKQVSVVPLPILEASPAPDSLAPPPYYAVANSPHVPHTREQAPEPLAKRPALKCAIPRATILTRTSPNGTTSALSSGSQFSAITLSSAVQMPQPSAIRYSSRWFATVDDGYPRNATDDDASSVRAAPGMQRVEPEQGLDLLDVEIDEDAMDWGMELQYPEDVSEMDISPCTSAISSTSSSTSESNSDSTVSSAGPATPLSTGSCPPLMIRIKRKSMEVRDEDLSEKRPRVFYNDEAQPARRNVIRIPARK